MEFVKQAQISIKTTRRSFVLNLPVYRQAYTTQTAYVSLGAQAYSESA